MVHRVQRRHHPGQGRQNPQGHQGLHHPQDGHPRHQSVGAGAHPPAHQDGEGGRRGADRDAGGGAQLAADVLFQPLEPGRPALAGAPGVVLVLRAPAGDFHPRQGARHRRKGQLEPHVPDGVAVEGAHPQPGPCQAGEGVGGGMEPHPRSPDDHRRGGPEHRGGAASDPRQQYCQPHRPEGPQPLGPDLSGVKAALDGPGPAHPETDQVHAQTAVEPGSCRPRNQQGQLLGGCQQGGGVPQPRQPQAAEDGDVHAADHQHMGQPCRPVGLFQIFGDEAGIPGDHGRQGPGLVPFQVPAEGLAEGLLEPGGPGPEARRRPQVHKAILIRRGEGVPVGVAALPVLGVGDIQHKGALDLFPRRAGGQVLAPAAEVCRLAAGLGHPQPGPDGAPLVALLDLLHRGGEGHLGPAEALGQVIQPALGAGKEPQPQRRPGQQPGQHPPPAGQTPAQHGRPNKESRKRPEGRLRLDGSHQLRAQRSGKQRTDRPPHPISGRTEAAAPGR